MQASQSSLWKSNIVRAAHIFAVEELDVPAFIKRPLDGGWGVEHGASGRSGLVAGGGWLRASLPPPPPPPNCWFLVLAFVRLSMEAEERVAILVATFLLPSK